jgi:hypothetical protein
VSAAAVVVKLSYERNSITFLQRYYACVNLNLRLTEKFRKHKLLWQRKYFLSSAELDILLMTRPSGDWYIPPAMLMYTHTLQLPCSNF